MIELLMKLNAPVATWAWGLIQTRSAEDKLISGDINDTIRFNYVFNFEASLTQEINTGHVPIVLQGNL